MILNVYFKILMIDNNLVSTVFSIIFSICYKPLKIFFCKTYYLDQLQNKGLLLFKARLNLVRLS